MARKLDSAGAGFSAAFDALLAARRGVAENVDREAAAIVGAVREGGDAALLDYTARFDRIALTPDTIRLSQDERAAAAAAAPNAVRDALVQGGGGESRPSTAASCRPISTNRDAAGVRLGARWRPLDAVGLYVPGGTAAYPSTVLMNAIPARVAGVERIAMVVPTPDGALDPAVMAAAEVAGVAEIYRVGGAQGRRRARPRHRDHPAGGQDRRPRQRLRGRRQAPCLRHRRHRHDRGAHPRSWWSPTLPTSRNGSRRDLLSQAEHDEDAQAILITDDGAFAARVSRCGGGAPGAAAAAPPSRPRAGASTAR